MSLDCTLPPKDATLANALIQWMRDNMVAQLTQVSPAPDLLHDLAQSNFETVCDALSRVGAFAAEGEYWRVLPVGSTSTDITRGDLDRLLNGLAIHSFYVTDLCPHDTPFTITDPALKPVCDALVDSGYVTPLGNGMYEWDDAFGPWLVRHGAWDIWEFEPAPEREVKEALAQIPAHGRERLSDQMLRRGPEFVRRFFGNWRNGSWHPDTWFDTPSHDDDVALASGIYEYFHGDHIP